MFKVKKTLIKNKNFFLIKKLKMHAKKMEINQWKFFTTIFFYIYFSSIYTNMFVIDILFEGWNFPQEKKRLKKNQNLLLVINDIFISNSNLNHFIH